MREKEGEGGEEGTGNGKMQRRNEGLIYDKGGRKKGKKTTKK